MFLLMKNSTFNLINKAVVLVSVMALLTAIFMTITDRF